MFRKLFIAIIVCLTAISCASTRNVETENNEGKPVPPVPPVFLNKYRPLTNDKLATFMEDWHAWSKKVDAFMPKSDSITILFAKVFHHYQKDLESDIGEYIVLPFSVEVIDNRHGKKDTTYMFPRYMKTNKNEPDRKVLYITPEIQGRLSRFLGRLRLNKPGKSRLKRSPVNERGLYTLAGYIPVHEGHWGGYWHLQSMPIIYDITITPDGYELSMRTSWWSGEITRVDKDMKTITQGMSWVE
ncbi:MAG: hypothetical protein J6T04_05845 [Bacteroidales bacterium]|nr:hypothetical protein [Bacteroidales bacterium]